MIVEAIPSRTVSVKEEPEAKVTIKVELINLEMEGITIEVDLMF